MTTIANPIFHSSKGMNFLGPYNEQGNFDPNGTYWRELQSGSSGLYGSPVAHPEITAEASPDYAVVGTPVKTNPVTQKLEVDTSPQKPYSPQDFPFLVATNPLANKLRDLIATNNLQAVWHWDGNEWQQSTDFEAGKTYSLIVQKPQSFSFTMNGQKYQFALKAGRNDITLKPTPAPAKEQQMAEQVGGIKNITKGVTLAQSSGTTELNRATTNLVNPAGNLATPRAGWVRGSSPSIAPALLTPSGRIKKQRRRSVVNDYLPFDGFGLRG